MKRQKNGVFLVIIALKTPEYKKLNNDFLSSEQYCTQPKYVDSPKVMLRNDFFNNLKHLGSHHKGKKIAIFFKLTCNDFDLILLECSLQRHKQSHLPKTPVRVLSVNNKTKNRSFYKRSNLSKSF